jgi:hypothetical protein
VAPAAAPGDSDKARSGRESAVKSPTGAVPPPGGPAYRPARKARRWQLTGLIIAVVLLAGGLYGVTTLRHPAHSSGGSAAGSSAAGSGLIAGATAVRGQAVSWITAQVDHTIGVACDEVMCSDLARHGFPPGNLNVLPPTVPDPYGSQLLIASTDVRSQFGSRLAFFAPSLIASFGTGAARIDIRVIAADGAAYQSALQQDLQKRKTSGSQLAGNKQVTVTRAARAQLLAGEVDLRLVTALAFLARQQPFGVVSFGGFAPGAAADVPLRWAYLAETDPAVHTSAQAYVRSLVTFAQSLRPPYAPLNVSPVQLAGRTVLRIEFAAPSPLNMLPS